MSDVSGRWALRLVGSQLTKAPGFANPFHTRIVSVLLLDQKQAGDSITADGTYCDHYTEDPDAVVHAVIPDAFRKALKPVKYSGTFAVDNGARRYRLDRLYEVLGATLSDPAKDMLPTLPTDMRVVDQDGDGHPGMTIHLTGLVDGEVYVAERSWTEADGVAVSADHIKGKIGFASEQNVLDSNPTSLKATTAASMIYPDPEACDSTFEIVRVSADATCDWVKNQESTLFGK